MNGIIPYHNNRQRYRACEVVICASPATHFHCFCHKAFYISNFKDFNTIAPAC